MCVVDVCIFFFFQAEDGIRDYKVTGVQTCALPISEEIAAVPGVDVLLIGTSDLCAEIGILGQVGDARVEAAYRRVIDACRRHGKHPGMGGVYDPPHMEKYVRMGMRFILGGSDLSLLMAAAKERAGFLRKAAGEA